MGSLETFLLPPAADPLEQGLRCVRPAWDSAQASRAPNVPPLLIPEHARLWSPPLYPTLGHLTWDDQDVQRELYSDPCGLLHPDCRRHRPRAQNTPPPGTERPAPVPTPKTQEPETRSKVAAAPGSPAAVGPADALPLSPCSEDQQLERET